MFCSKCGNPVADGEKFCETCGTQTEQDTAQAPGYTPVQPFQQQSTLGASPQQNQQTFFVGQQVSAGTSGQVKFKNGGKKKKGCLIAVIAVVLVLVLGIGGILLLGGDNGITNIQMASDVDSKTNLPATVTSVFKTDSPVVYCTFEANVDPGTIVTVEWWYVEYTDEQEYITSYDIETENNGDQLSYSLSMPDAGWPVGSYEARIVIDNTQVGIGKFEVK